jgi:hypothetical protein
LTGGAIVAGAALAPAAHAASADDFTRLRACESGGNYQADTGNGFYGAYQFAVGTWHSLGYSGLPSDAAPGTQDAAARHLQSERGWSPWPACSSRLGLGNSSATHYVTASSTHAVLVHLSTRPGPMSEQYAGVSRNDVRQLQNDLVFVGYNLDIDGHFGSQTDSVVRSFQKTSHITVDGVAGPDTLKAVNAAKAVRWRALSGERIRAI